MTIPLTKYGLREILLVSAACAAAAAVCLYTWPPLALLPAIVWVATLAFFRDGPRQAEGEGFLAVADGTVTDITPVGPDGPLGRKGIRVGVFMSVTSVHVNRAPCQAAVVKVEHCPGGYVDVRKQNAWDTNESSTIYLSVRGGERDYPVLVRQIAGFIARRIVTDLAPGQPLHSGQRIGMIKFGSRGELIVPEELAGTVAVRVGERVYAGQSVLIRPRPPENTE
jgi:phosphatidylserine decarboxylase